MLGHIGYYQKFIKIYAQITTPMEQLLKKDATYCWNEECNKSLEMLNEKMALAPILVFSKWDIEFHAHCVSHWAWYSHRKEQKELITRSRLLVDDHPKLRGTTPLLSVMDWRWYTCSINTATIYSKDTLRCILITLL